MMYVVGVQEYNEGMLQVQDLWWIGDLPIVTSPLAQSQLALAPPFDPVQAFIIKHLT